MTIYPQRSEITALHFNKVVFLRVLCYKFHRSLKSARYIAQAGREGEQKTKKKHSESPIAPRWRRDSRTR